MTILADLLDQILEQDPHASAEYFLVARQYIQTQWQALHGTPMPEEALTLYTWPIRPAAISRRNKRPSRTDA